MVFSLALPFPDINGVMGLFSVLSFGIAGWF